MKILALLFVAFACAAVLVAEEQERPVFTREQVEAGRVAYSKNCASCHMPDLTGNAEIPPLAGETFLGTWDRKTTKDLRDYMAAAMPYGGPSLDAESYSVVTAFILSFNGAIAGTEKLTAATNVPIRDLIASRVPH